MTHRLGSLAGLGNLYDDLRRELTDVSIRPGALAGDVTDVVAALARELWAHHGLDQD